MNDINNINPETHVLLNKYIMLKIETVSEKTGNGFFLPDETIKKLQSSVICGELVKHSNDAFDGLDSNRPEIGDKVFFRIYAGNLLFDGNGERYRILPVSEMTGFERKE